MSSFPNPAEIARALAGRPVVSVSPVGHSGNSRVWRIGFGDGSQSALKLYPAFDAGQQRDRIGAETAALNFLAGLNFADVPRMLAGDRRYNAALLSWMNGQSAGTTVHIHDAERLLSFLSRLHAARTATGASDLPLASESCLAPAQAALQAKRRFLSLLYETGQDASLCDAIAGVFLPALDIACARAEGALGEAYRREIPREFRTLSPSDFGLHNALRLPDEGLAFLDFEYFGWDDPVKLVADTLLHPGMTFASDAEKAFHVGALSLYSSNDPGFSERLSSLWRLYALRWCAILLNPYLAQWRDSRSPPPTGWDAMKRRNFDCALDRMRKGRKLVVNEE